MHPDANASLCLTVKDLEFNLYCEICSCEGSSSARNFFRRAYHLSPRVSKCLGPSGCDYEAVISNLGGWLEVFLAILFNDLESKLEIFWFRTSRHEVSTSEEEIL